MSKTNIDTTIHFARRLYEDELKKYQNEFYRQPDSIYMDGNSLGSCQATEDSLLNMLHSWKTNGIDGWTKGNHPGFMFPNNWEK